MFTKAAYGAKMVAFSTNAKVAARCRLNISSRQISRSQILQMKRDEFTARTKDQAAQRASGFCEKCKSPMAGRRYEFDHVLPAAFGGKATLANCQAICSDCHKQKTANDVRGIRKADRQRRAATGSERTKPAIPSRPKAPKPPPKPKAPQRRDVFNREI